MNSDYQNTSKNCDQENSGVNLNKNYPESFVSNPKNGTEDPCDLDFRGPEAFSEPETRAIRNLIESRQNNLRIVYNIQTIGEHP